MSTKMDGENASKTYSPLTETQLLFNNPELSDVRFLIDGQTVYGHKVILAMGSPVFKSMFFGELKEQREVIEIKDLTPVGFKNALRYIYGFEIDFELADLYDSFRAADKYLLHHFSKAFFEYIQGKLNAESSCLIYDQLIKIGEREEISLASIRTTIIENSRVTIGSDHFAQIDQETLIRLLSLDQLKIAEFDLLIAVSKWVDCEMQRECLSVNRENRRKIFEPIKGYILFSSLTPEKIASSEKIAELLTEEELLALLLHLLDRKKNPLKIELKTSREARSTPALSVFVNSTVSGNFHVSGGYYSLTRKLSVSRRTSVQTIYTTILGKEANLRLKILDSDDRDLGLKIERFVQDGSTGFSFNPPFVMEPNTIYKLQIIGDGQMKAEDCMSNQSVLNYNGSVVFYLDNSYIYHFVRGVVFFL